MKTKDIYINIDQGNIQIGFVVVSKQEDGIVSSYMPGFDIYYSSPDMDTAKERGEAMVHNFFNFWIEKQSWKKFVLKIHALGFRAKLHDFKMKNLLKNRPEKAGFHPSIDEEATDFFDNGGNLNRSASVVELAS